MYPATIKKQTEVNKQYTTQFKTSYSIVKEELPPSTIVIVCNEEHNKYIEADINYNEAVE